MQFSLKTLSTLEYDKIIEMLAECASTEGAKARARALAPTDDAQAVIIRQRRTDDAKRLINAKGYPSFTAPEGVDTAADRAYKGAILSPRELMDIAALLRSAASLVDYVGEGLPFECVLEEIFLRMLPNRQLENKISRAIISEELIADEASPALADIRRKIRNTNNKIKDTLQSYIGGARHKHLQENIVTMRNGRYVVPVKAEYRNEIKGLVHDTSSSGATLFVEPMAVVEANNDLKRLAAEESCEIERILASLSAEVADFSSAIATNYHNVTDLAFIFACATLAISMRAEMPIITEDRLISLRRARHPLIPKDKVVPIDVSLGGEFDTLIITGPNTGGKTVTLKTLGLFALMAQSGLQLPAAEGSVMGVFSEVLVDIGDEQSIEASLSTFSSHMVNVAEILRCVGPRSLALFDELGSGTDPIEGAALATAILERTQKKGALTAATTHYAELKAYALNTPRVKNASCEFDVETLRPTYRLIIGAPGKSNAFAISERLGLDPEVISRAEMLIDGDDKRFEEVIERLEKDRIEMQRARDEAERELRELREYRAREEAALEAKIKKSEEEIRKMLLKARQILDSARATSEYIFKQLDDIRRQENKEKRYEMADRARAEVQKRLRETEELFEGVDVREVAVDEDYKLPRELRVGDRVYLVTIGKEGVVTATKDKNGLVAVTSGILKTKVTEDKLRLIEGEVKFRRKEEPKPKVNEGKVKRQVNTSFRPELDVRGMIGEDAWFLVDKYLDDAILAGIKTVRIIHGKGTGALRAALWKYFKTDKRIKSYRHGEYGEGDAGVTVIELK